MTLYSIGENASEKRIIKLINKQAQWSESLNCFIMNFNGKCKYPSVKNMILVHEDDENNQALLFCKSESNGFHMELTSPLTSFIAFGLVLSAFDFKLLCQ
jgi:hypothetical protein